MNSSDLFTTVFWLPLSLFGSPNLSILLIMHASRLTSNVAEPLTKPFIAPVERRPGFYPARRGMPRTEGAPVTRPAATSSLVQVRPWKVANRTIATFFSSHRQVSKGLLTALKHRKTSLHCFIGPLHTSSSCQDLIIGSAIIVGVAGTLYNGLKGEPVVCDECNGTGGIRCFACEVNQLWMTRDCLFVSV